MKDKITEIKITRPLATLLLGLAQKSPQREICGVIGGNDKKPQTVYPVANLATDPAHKFAMDPQEQIAAFKTMRAKGESLFAIYHSHPQSPPVPSIQDVENLGYAEALQLIISLNTKGVLEMRAYRKHGGELEEVQLSV
ncbi:MAG TPA: M67 family metallopeptidase [Gammaproteobacteria bacterium]